MRKLFFCVLLLLAGCERDADDYQKIQAAPVSIPTQQQNARFDVERIQVFGDSLSYNNKRGIYIITDKKTGKEYFGVSGIGITETGSHLAGKVTIADER